MDNENIILEDVTYAESPQQMNAHDCSLYALGVLLHLSQKKPVNGNSFNQNHINHFRKGLFHILNITNEKSIGEPRKFISQQFINYFFPSLHDLGRKQDEFLYYYHKKGYESTPAAFVSNGSSTEHSTSGKSTSDFEVGSVEESLSVTDEEDYEKKPPAKPNSMVRSNLKLNGETNFVPTNLGTNQLVTSNEIDDDVHFKCIFIDNDPIFDGFKDLSIAINEYTNVSGNTLAVFRGSHQRLSRTYKCVQHLDCTFKAPFGPPRGESYLMFKGKHAVLKHNAVEERPDFAEDGRAWKQRREGWLEESVTTIVNVKAKRPEPKDVIKAGNNIEGKSPTYNQAFRVLTKPNLEMKKKKKKATN
jgi:hypothetical protein